MLDVRKIPREQHRQLATSAQADVLLEGVFGGVGHGAWEGAASGRPADVEEGEVMIRREYTDEQRLLLRANIPGYYGYAYRPWDNHNISYWYPVPLNILVRFFVTVHRALRNGFFPMRWEKQLLAFYSQGHKDGWDQHERHVAKMGRRDET